MTPTDQTTIGQGAVDDNPAIEPARSRGTGAGDIESGGPGRTSNDTASVIEDTGNEAH